MQFDWPWSERTQVLPTYCTTATRKLHLDHDHMYSSPPRNTSSNKFYSRHRT